MLCLHVRNVNGALPVMLNNFRQAMEDKEHGKVRQVTPRGHRRIEWTEPVATHYSSPRERVLFNAARDCNPFLHLADALWVLAGREDVDSVAYYVPRMAEYSDDGRTLHGAYGGRLAQYGQLNAVIARLRSERDSTRCVLALYDNQQDRVYTGKDMPCNCTVFFTLRDGWLDMSVANRSNDLILGAYGANAVQFSMLQEYVASACEAGVGAYTQFSHNTHIYPDEPATQRCLQYVRLYESDDRYAMRSVQPMPMIVDWNVWNVELRQWWQHKHKLQGRYEEPFFEEVMRPLERAFVAYKDKRFLDAIANATQCAAGDWRAAAVEWLARREESHAMVQASNAFNI